MNYNENQTETLIEFIRARKEQIRNGSQGHSINQILGDEIIYTLQSRGVPIKSISCNYYECEGKADTMIVCAFKIDDGTSFFEPYNCRLAGFKVRVSKYSTGGHLTRYVYV